VTNHVTYSRLYVQGGSKHGVIKVCSIEYLTTEIELVLSTFKSWTTLSRAVHTIIEYLTSSH